MRRRAPVLALLLMTVAVGAFLLRFGPTVDQVTAGARDLQGYVERYGADQSVILLIAVALWAVLGWLWIGLAATAASAAPGAVGAVARFVADRMTPVVLRRAVGMAVGIGVVTSVPAYATGPGGTGASSGGSYLVATAPSYQFSAAPARRDDTVPGISSVIQPQAGGDPDPGVDWTAPSEPTAATPKAVTVLEGDCLWDIVAARLDPAASARQIASAVVRWWKANESVIGDDPNLLLPGQVLTAPTD